MVSKLLDDNTANIEKAKSLTAGLSAAQMNWRPQPGKWSIAQNLEHLNFGYQYFDAIASSIAAARAKGIIGNGVNWNGKNYGLGVYEKDRLRNSR